MKVRYCPHCNKFEVSKKADFIHTKADCPGRLVKLDSNMAPIIKELNSLGFKTEYCCSGHPKENYVTSYIMFAEAYPEVKDAAEKSKLQYEEHCEFLDKNAEKYYIPEDDPKWNDFIWIEDLTKTNKKLCIVRDDYTNLPSSTLNDFNLESIKRHANTLKKFLRFVNILIKNNKSKRK